MPLCHPAARCLIALLLAFAAAAAAQDTGQICVSVFLDWNENGAPEAAEAQVTRGIGAAAIDERGLTVATQLLEDSPLAADGTLCLHDLVAGEYQVLLSSSEYNATRSAAFKARVQPGAPPPLLDFGVRPLSDAFAQATADESFSLDLAAASGLLTVALSGVGILLLLSAFCARASLLLLRRIRRRRAPTPSDPVAGD